MTIYSCIGAIDNADWTSHRVCHHWHQNSCLHLNAELTLRQRRPAAPAHWTGPISLSQSQHRNYDILSPSTSDDAAGLCPAHATRLSRYYGVSGALIQSAAAITTLRVLYTLISFSRTCPLSTWKRHSLAPPHSDQFRFRFFIHQVHNKESVSKAVTRHTNISKQPSTLTYIN